MKAIRKQDKLIYGLGNLSNGVILQALTTYLVFFGTSILGVSGTVIGIMVSVSVIWDALSDPLIGYISDNTRNKLFGRRHLYMIIGTVGLAFFNGFLWSIQSDWQGITKTVMIFVSVILVKTFMTVFVTPYNALGGELSSDYHERTSIQAYRTVFFTIGLAFTTVAGMFFYFKPTTEYPKGQLNPQAYQSLGISISVIILICSLLAVLGTLKYIPQLPKAVKEKEAKGLGPLIQEFKGIFLNKNYLYVSGAYLSANISTAILGAIGLHVFTYTFAMTNIGIGVIFGTMFACSILSQAFWLWITKLYDKKDGALMAVGIALLASVIFLILVLYKELVIDQYLWLILYAVPAGVGIGGLITLPFSMIADTVDEEEVITGHRSEGLYYGGLTFSYKMSQSLAIVIVGIILDLARFDASATVQEEVTLIVLGLVVAVGALVSLLAAGYFYLKYDLTKAKVEAIKAQLNH